MSALTTLGRRPLSDPPGGVLMWIVVALELLTFGIVFTMIAAFRSGDPETFRAGQAVLDPGFGLLLTLTLLTSGWLVAEAVHAVRQQRVRRAKRLYAMGIAVGLGFVALKVADFVRHPNAISLGDDFGAAFLLATGFHLLHVLVGLAMLTHVARKLGRRPFEDEETAVAGTGLFWHMCDLAWLFLFPLFFV